MNQTKQKARLLAIDIDGTLLDSSYRIPAENLAALRRAHEAGVEMVLVTGRRHAFAMPVAMEPSILAARETRGSGHRTVSTASCTSAATSTVPLWKRLGAWDPRPPPTCGSSRAAGTCAVSAAATVSSRRGRAATARRGSTRPPAAMPRGPAIPACRTGWPTRFRRCSPTWRTRRSAHLTPTGCVSWASTRGQPRRRSALACCSACPATSRYGSVRRSGRSPFPTSPRTGMG